MGYLKEKRYINIYYYYNEETGPPYVYGERTGPPYVYGERTVHLMCMVRGRSTSW